MEILTTSLMSLGLAADAFAVSLTSGFIIKHIKVNKALKIALFFGGFQGLMPFIGWSAGLAFRDFLSGIDHWIAFGVLSLIGGKMVYEAMQEEGEERKFNPLDSYTLLALAIATSLDALVAGLGLSVIKTPILLACTLIGLITFALSLLGVFIGHKFGNILHQKIEILGGLILIAIAVKILVQNFVS